MLFCSCFVFIPLALVVVYTGGGIFAIWSALFVFMCARVLSTGVRYRSMRWVTL